MSPTEMAFSMTGSGFLLYSGRRLSISCSSLTARTVRSAICSASMRVSWMLKRSMRIVTPYMASVMLSMARARSEMSSRSSGVMNDV